MSEAAKGGSSHLVTLSPDLSEVARGRRFLAEIASDAGFSEERAFDITVACSEAMANAIEHSPVKGEVEVRALLYPDRLEVEIQGPGQFQAPDQLKERAHRGMGLPLMARLSDHLALFSGPEGQTFVSLTFYRAGATPRGKGALPPTFANLAQENQLLDDVLSHLPDHFYVLDHQWRFIYVNAAVLASLGVTADSLLGHVIWDRFKDLDADARRMHETAGLDRTAASAVVHYGGEWREWTAFPVNEGVAVFCRDITERMKAEKERDQLLLEAQALNEELASVNEELRCQTEELVEREFALRESEERYRLLVEKAGDGIFLSDAEGHYTEANPSGLQMLGYTLEELRKLSVTDVIVPVDPKRMAEEMENLARGAVIANEWKFRRKDGSTFTGEVVGRRLPDGRLLGILRDVTWRTEAEEALRRSEERLSRAQEIAHLGSWELDLVKNELTWSDEAYRIFGLEPQEFGATYEAFLERVHPDDRNTVDEAYTSSLRENRDAYEVEHRVVARDSGEVRLVHEKCQHYRDATGTIVRSVGMVHDITERKAAEEALRRSERRYRSFTEVTSQWAWVTDPEGMVVEDIPALRSFTGQTYEEAKDAGWADALHPDDVQRTLQVWSRAVQTRTPYEIEYRMRRHDGVYRVLLARGVPILSDEGDVVEWVGTCIDIDERKQAEREREELLTSERRLAEGLAAANVALQSQTEELAAINQELHAQTEELVTRDEELKAQNDDLILMQRRLEEASRMDRALGEISESLNSTLETTEMLRRVVDGGARALGAHQALLEFLESGGWRVERVFGLPDELQGQHLAFAQAPIATTMFTQGRLLVVDDLRADKRFNRSRVRDYAATAGLAVPVMLRGEILGCLQFMWTDGPRRFSNAETDFLGKLSNSLALALENARLYETQKNIARQLQNAILDMPVEVAGLDFTHLYRSATEEAIVGGDFYDVFERPDGSIILLAGDVSGHGVNAARVATMVKTSLVAFAQQGDEPGGVLENVNRLLVRKRVPGFTTVLFGVYDRSSSRLTYCSAGHPNLLVGRGDGSVELVGRNHAPLGIFADWSCSVDSLQVGPDDTLLLYTDGLTEARLDGEMFGERRLAEALARRLPLDLSELPEALLEDALEFSEGRLRDDVAILAVRPRG